MNPSTPDEVALASLDGVGKGPVTFTHPDDEFVVGTWFSLSRADATQVWRSLQETSTRRPDRIAK